MRKKKRRRKKLGKASVLKEMKKREKPKHDRLTLWTGAAAASAIYDDHDDDDVCPANTKELLQRVYYY